MFVFKAESNLKMSYSPRRTLWNVHCMMYLLENKVICATNKHEMNAYKKCGWRLMVCVCVSRKEPLV
jgi:hypothetical protein